MANVETQWLTGDKQGYLSDTETKDQLAKEFSTLSDKDRAGSRTSPRLDIKAPLEVNADFVNLNRKCEHQPGHISLDAGWYRQHYRLCAGRGPQEVLIAPCRWPARVFEVPFSCR